MLLFGATWREREREREREWKKMNQLVYLFSSTFLSNEL
jgi:hypothetical protein